MIPPTNGEKVILATTISISGWYVCADNVADVGRLIDRGWARAVDDYESISVYATPDGVRAAEEMGLVEPNQDNASKWDRTKLAFDLEKRANSTTAAN